MTKRFSAGSVVVLAVLCSAFPCHSLASASKADKAFAGKVGQGGMYEVVASRLAESKASAPDVKDLATTEVHDHSLVNRNLKKIAMQNGIMLKTRSSSLRKQLTVPAAFGPSRIRRI